MTGTASLITDFQEGATYRRTLQVSVSLMDDFARLSSDLHRLHTDEAFARSKGFKSRVAYGNILGLMVSALVGMDLKSENVMLISQRMAYRSPVYVGDTIELQASVSIVSEASSVVELKLAFKNQDSETVATGVCQVKVL